ncbi:kinase-like domain-containing protein [Lasiosphaeria hispida]|uniref:non-specific serine/threonine protein kinase n=1 Tax=Lasiosphaeria hispida TaxID=260671 RepID=A0AAJ0HDV9_9PEZI|nr:kinase-like domain-containing protein [Lasiosphaeria hispida]
MPVASPRSDQDNGLRLKLAPFKLEHIQDYQPGGYHPIHLGDILNGYHVIHKLGSGGFATIWLARNGNIQDTTKYVALKVIRADASGDDCPELIMSRLIPSKSTELEEREHDAGLESICLPLEHFKIEGPNGSHLCFVYPVLGLRVSHGAFRASDDLGKILRQVCYKVAAGLASLHAEGICHGDLTPQNILHPITGLDGLPEGEMIKILGEPQRNPVLDASGKENSSSNGPKYLVYPVNWGKLDAKFFVQTPQIIDFGEAFEVSQPPPDLGTPGPYRSPELLLDLENVAGVSSDLWALGCTLFEIRTGRKLFNLFADEYDDYLDAMCMILGKLPEPWWSTTWEARKAVYKDEADENGRVILVNQPEPALHTMQPSVVKEAREPRSLLEKIEPGLEYMEGGSYRREILAEERQLFADLLGKLLQYKPEERMSAKMALDHEWFKL